MRHESGEEESRLDALQLYAVLEGVQDAVVVTEPSGEVVYMNAAAMRLYGVEGQHETRGAGFDLLAHAQGVMEVSTLDGAPVSRDDEPLRRALRGDTYKDVEVLVKRRGVRDPRVYVFNGSRVETDPPLNVLTIRDETDHWRTQRRYRVAFEADPAPSVIARLEDGRIVAANEGMADLTGLDTAALLERSLVDLNPLRQADDLIDLAERLRDGRRFHKVRRLLLDAAGKDLPVLLSARSIELEGENCGIFTFIDISELEAAQRERRDTQELLDVTLREHAEEKVAMDQLATTDPLTGLANRRGLNSRLGEERARAERYNDTFSLLMLDLDRFKRVNDTFGHDRGDLVLREVARILEEACREPDLAGRWGGEEFMMILPQIDLDEARGVADRIRERVAGTKFAEVVDLTVSIGVATLEGGDDVDGLFARADRALYAAKERGRNRVESSSAHHEDA